jgi:hypothetical protein
VKRKLMVCDIQEPLDQLLERLVLMVGWPEWSELRE